MPLSGFVATDPGLDSSTPPSLREALGRTLIGGLGSFIDLEIAERVGSLPTTQSDVRRGDRANDPSQPEVGITDLLVSPSPATRVLLLGLAVGGFLLLRQVLK